MSRKTGKFRINQAFGEEVRAFIPHPLPPANPSLDVSNLTDTLHSAQAALAQLAITGSVVPNIDWFLYGFVRKEAVITSQIEGTQATLRDIASFEATSKTDRPDDVEEVCNYVEALKYARQQIATPDGLPLSTRLLCEIHLRLMQGVRGQDKQPGEVRRSQNWIGGSRPGNAQFVPPPPEEVMNCLTDLECWIHSGDSLPPLIKAGLAHVQFETIHPFLDGNGRIGRMLIGLLIEHWGLLNQPLLYLSLAFKQRQQEYYQRLAAVRSEGDWEGWTEFFLDCVNEAAGDGIRVAQSLNALIARDREKIVKHERSTVAAIQLLEHLPSHPIITNAIATKLLGLTAPPTRKAIDLLESAGILRETTGQKRDRVYAYQDYLHVLTADQK